MSNKEKKIQEAQAILKDLGMPRAQQNERSALTLLALLNLTPNKKWSNCKNPNMGITPIMDWIRDKYGKDYAPNSRETFRRQTMHQFVDAALAVINPDDNSRPINSPKTVYQIESEALTLLRTYGSNKWKQRLRSYRSLNPSLRETYLRQREQELIPLKINDGEEKFLSSGNHSELIKAIVEDFAQRFAPGADLIYVGDTGAKWAYADEVFLAEFGIDVGSHGKMPDVIVYQSETKWLFLIEAVTSHGPVDGKRYKELADLFGSGNVGLVFVTAFPSRSDMTRYIGEIAWETEVWVADNPSHLIHFDGERFLGPYG